MKKEQYEASKTNIAPATLGEFFTLCINLILQEFNLDPVKHVVADPDPVKLRAKQRARGIRQQVNAAQNQPDVSPIQSPLRRREPPGPQQMSPPPQPQQPQNQPIARVRGRGRGARGTVGTGRLSPIRERTISPVPGTSGLSNRGRGRGASPSISPITGTRGHGRGGRAPHLPPHQFLPQEIAPTSHLQEVKMLHKLQELCLRMMCKVIHPASNLFQGGGLMLTLTRTGQGL